MAKTIKFAKHRNAIWGHSIGIILGRPVLASAIEDASLADFLDGWEWRTKAPRAFMAEQQDEQVLYFLGGILDHIDKYPEAGYHAVADLMTVLTPNQKQISTAEKAIAEAIAQAPEALKEHLGPFGVYLVSSCLD